MANLEELLSNLKIADSETRTGLIYDNRMAEHHCLWDPNHHDKPDRFLKPLERCKSYGLVQRCLRLTPRFADENELKLLHSEEYIENIKKTKYISDDTVLENLASAYESVYFNPKTYDCALLSAGCTLELVSAVVTNKVQNGLAIVRPPGHHAMFDDASGYCFFNNVALAAKHAMINYGIEKILIIDWDVHHGHGTQQMFYDDERVLYFSIHRYHYGEFYPQLRESNFDFTGEGLGKGFNANVALNKMGLGNTEYLAIFHNVLLPMAFEFNPQLILISAGYDAAMGCPEGQMEVSPYAYAHLLNEVSGLAGGRVCVVLEGGYCLLSLSEAVAITLKTLLGDNCPRISSTGEVDDSAVDSILNTISTLRPMWKSFSLQSAYDPQSIQKEFDVKRHIVSTRSVGYLKPPKMKFKTRNDCRQHEPIVYEMYDKLLKDLIDHTDLTVPNHKTCLVYNERMTKHAHVPDDWHPEVKERIMNIKERLHESGLDEKCLYLQGREATEEELAFVHDQSHIDTMKELSKLKQKQIMKLEVEYNSVYLCESTYDAAIVAAGSLLQVVDEVVTGKCSNGFAIIRPPGHHAEADKACGFCIFNSVAIAAKYAIKNYSSFEKPINKVLIIDWDIHHGNGTQHIFYDDKNVLYISLHRYDDATFFPNDVDANFSACGSGSAAGYNINIPWNALVSDGAYLAAFFRIILPVAYEFNPDLVLVSSGFDAAINDPLGGCSVSPSCYGHMAKLLSGLANGKIILALEGGYNLPSVSEAAYHCVRALLGEPCSPFPEGVYPTKGAIKTIQEVVHVHEKYWKCLRFGLSVPDLDEHAKKKTNEAEASPIDTTDVSSHDDLNEENSEQ